MNPEETLALWQAEDTAIRARLQPTPGVASPAQIARRSGLQILEAISAGELPLPPMAGTLDFIPVHIESGYAVFQGRPDSSYYNPMGTVHGGWYATMLDTAMGCAVHSTLPAGKAYTTLELKLNLIRPLSEAVPLVRVEGRLVHGGGRVATAEGQIFGPDGKLYALASTTCLLFKPT
ncbi:PaaI family thioesterase [Marinobacterium lutimaris]|nr:PaaI family thioesterase [Marinobacterium lutimaris]